MRRMDLAAIMRTVGTPFFVYKRDRLTIHQDRDILQEVLKPLLTEVSPSLKYQLKDSYAVSSVAKSCFDTFDHKQLAKILEQTDRIVLFQVGDRGFALPVRLRAGHAKVAGLWAGPLLLWLFAPQDNDHLDKRTQLAQQTGIETVQRLHL